MAIEDTWYLGLNRVVPILIAHLPQKNLVLFQCFCFGEWQAGRSGSPFSGVVMASYSGVVVFVHAATEYLGGFLASLFTLPIIFAFNHDFFLLATG